MEWRVLTDPGEFLDLAGVLLEDEGTNNLILGIARRMIAAPDRYEGSGLFVVQRDGAAVAAALVTPPFNLILADSPDGAAIGQLVAVVQERHAGIPGVTGNRPAVDTFKDAWVAAAGCEATLEMEQGIFSLETVNDEPNVPGNYRRATMDDRDLVVSWMREFAAEALPRGVEEQGRFITVVRRRLEGLSDSGFWLWEVDDRAVAISGHTGPTGSGIRINGVYTPPAERRNGYATALVAKQSQWLLDHGYRFCFLYTDLGNPTSNAIYRRIGYRQVSESAMYRFDNRQQPVANG